MRNHLSVRDIRCDLFSLESLSAALHVRKSEIINWIDNRWLPVTVYDRGERHYARGPGHLYNTCNGGEQLLEGVLDGKIRCLDQLELPT